MGHNNSRAGVVTACGALATLTVRNGGEGIVHGRLLKVVVGVRLWAVSIVNAAITRTSGGIVPINVKKARSLSRRFIGLGRG